MYRLNIKYCIVFFVLISLASCLGMGPVQEKATQEVTAMGDALLAKDYEKYAGYIPDWAIRPARDRKEWIEKLKHGLHELELKGNRYTAAHYELISEVVEEDGLYQCLFKQEITLSSNYTSSITESYVLGTSEDTEHWQFADVTYMSRTQLLQVVPKLSADIRVPGWKE